MTGVFGLALCLIGGAIVGCDSRTLLGPAGLAMALLGLVLLGQL